MSKIAESYVLVKPSPESFICSTTVKVDEGISFEVNLYLNPATKAVETVVPYNENGGITFNIETEDTRTAEEVTAKIAEYLDNLGAN